MDNKETNNEMELEIKIEEDESCNLTISEQIYQIEVRMQEIDALIERYEDQMMQNEEAEVDNDEISALKYEYKKLRAQRKQLLKQTSKGSKWDKMPIWMFLYGAFQFIFSFYYVISMISVYFAQWLFNTFTITMNQVTKYVSALFIPIFSLIVSLVILLLIKDKTKFRFFLYIYIIQGIETIISIIYMIIALSKV